MRTLLVLLSCLPALLLATEMPSRIEANYDVLSKGVKMAEVKELFVRTNEHYRIQSITKPVGLLALFQPETIVVTSEGDITEEGLHPLRFTHQRLRDASRNTSAEFDWAAAMLTLNDQAGIRQVALPPGTQDRLSVMYQFVAVAPMNRLELKFNMTNGSKLENYRYQAYPNQTVAVPYGVLKSHYLYTPPQRTAWKSEIWLATEYSDMPCKIVVTDDDGGKVVQVLATLNIVP